MSELQLDARLKKMSKELDSDLSQIRSRLQSHYSSFNFTKEWANRFTMAFLLLAQNRAQSIIEGCHRVLSSISDANVQEFNDISFDYFLNHDYEDLMHFGGCTLEQAWKTTTKAAPNNELLKVFSKLQRFCLCMGLQKYPARFLLEFEEIPNDEKLWKKLFPQDYGQPNASKTMLWPPIVYDRCDFNGSQEGSVAFFVYATGALDRS